MTLYLPPNHTILWSKPDTNPYTGTIPQAIHLLTNSGYPDQVVRDQFSELHHNECSVRKINNGLLFQTMLFDKNKIEHNVVAETIDWKSSTPRTSLVCSSNYDGWKYELWVPFACGNYSERVVQIAIPIPVIPGVLSSPLPPGNWKSETPYEGNDYYNHLGLSNMEVSSYPPIEGVSGSVYFTQNNLAYKMSKGLQEENIVLEFPSNKVKNKVFEFIRNSRYRRYQYNTFQRKIFRVQRYKEYHKHHYTTSSVPGPMSLLLFITFILEFLIVVRFFSYVNVLKSEEKSHDQTAT